MPYRYKQPGNWKTTRRRILNRDNHTCACGSPATQVDHIVNVMAGGTHDDHNLRAVCAPCHDVKTQREAQAGRQQREQSTRRATRIPGLLP